MTGESKLHKGPQGDPAHNPLQRAALYYPYIHIRSEHWLKATLLCAP
jgi:hypothetical protein